MYKILLLVICIFQIVLAIIAEYNEEYVKAVYEMLWLFFFTYLLQKDES